MFDEDRVVQTFDRAAAVIHATRTCAKQVCQLAEAIVRALLSGKKVLVFGNGGSAADAQHFAGELIGRFQRDREALPAIALTTDTSVLTAVANDFSFNEVFARQLRALAQAGDVVIGITTSGKSPNVLEGLHIARERGATTAMLTGEVDNALRAQVDICITVPSRQTPRIQEAHEVILHTICELVEERMCMM